VVDVVDVPPPMRPGNVAPEWRQREGIERLEAAVVEQFRERGVATATASVESWPTLYIQIKEPECLAGPYRVTLSIRQVIHPIHDPSISASATTVEHESDVPVTKQASVNAAIVAEIRRVVDHIITTYGLGEAGRRTTR